MTIDGNVLTADDGTVLTNGETYSKRVYLGKYDSPANWWKVYDSEVPKNNKEIYITEN